MQLFPNIQELQMQQDYFVIAIAIFFGICALIQCIIEKNNH
jgi:hypothetical protein